MIARQLTFSIDQPIILYIAIESYVDNPLPAEFVNSKEIFSVLHVQPEQNLNSIMVANESRKFEVYYNKYGAGIVQIDFKPKLNQLLNLILFYKQIDEQQKQCGGLERLVAAILS